MSDKIYCGNGRVQETKYGKRMRLSFSKEDLKKMADNLDNGWVNVNINERKQPSDTGVTHYLTVDTWKPDQNRTVNKKKPPVFPDMAEQFNESQDLARLDDQENLPF